MNELRFADPHIRASTTLELGDYRVTMPLITADEAERVVAATTARAREYFAAGGDGLAAIGKAFVAWQDPAYPLRRAALPVLAHLTGCSPESIYRFGLWPLGRLRPDRAALDRQHEELGALIASGAYRSFTRWGDGYIKAYGQPDLAVHPPPGLLLQVLAGNVVGPNWLALLFGAGGRCGQLLKLPSGDPVSFLYLLESIAEVDPAFRETIACGYYASGSDVHGRLLGAADVVFAMGSDDTMASLQDQIDREHPRARLVAHGRKIGFQVVGRDYAVDDVAELVAWGASACDGNACFSPANVFVETGGPLSPGQFAEAVAGHMERIARDVPAKRALRAAERVTDYRQQQQQRRLLGERVRVLKSRGTDYTVVVDEEEPLLTPTCQERAIVVKPLDAVEHVVDRVSWLSGNLQTVGLAVPTGQLLELAERLGAAGATNIKVVGTEYIIGEQEPHDGIFDALRLSASDGLRWAAVTFGDTERAIATALETNRNAPRAGC